MDSHNQVYLLNGAIHFLDDTKPDFDKCWIYVGRAYWKDGYPIIRRKYKNWIASRYVWYLVTHRDYWTREVHHICKNRACVNPTHLTEMTKTKHRRYHNKERKS